MEREDGVVLIDSITNENLSKPALVWLPTLRSSEVRTLKVTVYTESSGTAIIVWIGVGIGVDFIGDVIWNTYKHMWEPVGDEQTLNQAFWECFRKGWDDTLEEWKGGEVPLWSAIKNIGERLLRDSILGPFMIAYKLGEFFYNWAVNTLEGGQLYLNAVEQQEKSKDIRTVHATTPEDKYGPTGYDPPGTLPEERKRFVNADRDHYFRVDFWNKEDATAPAYDVLVEDQLNSNLDWSNFRFEDTGFLKWNVDLRPCQYFNVDVDTRPDMDWIVNVEGTFDPETGKVTWWFRTLDPNTHETPADPMAGFLPPITESGEEIGWVGFTVRPKAGLATGTHIANQAFVEFDHADDLYDHPAPKEGPWTNTLDAEGPASQVLPLPEFTETRSFLVEWSGQDDLNGSGIQGYDIYVSTDSSDYVLWLANADDTSGTFIGEGGHTYSFYSRARDNVGHVEPAPDSPDSTTTSVWITGDFCGANSDQPDGYVDYWDLLHFARRWHTSPGDPDWDPRCDLAEEDSYVDYWDLLVFARHWHEGEPP